MDTLLLNLDNWDLCLDAQGNIAMATQPYSISQDVASAVRLFFGELWYDNTKGVPYFSEVLGENPSMALLKSLVVKAAMTVPDVVAAECLIASYAHRVVTGQVQVVDTEGTTTVVNF